MYGFVNSRNYEIKLSDLNFDIPIKDVRTRTQIREMINSERVPHATLFSGQEGGNVLLEALYMLSYLMCENPQPEGFCTQCRQCIRIQKWMHPDVNLVVPTFDSKDESRDVMGKWREFTATRDFFTFEEWSSFMEATKSPNINRRQTQAVMHSYHLKPYEGGKKVFFVWGVEFLGKESNRFLKILEEPTEQTYFILVTHNKQSLLPTILSRVQQFDVGQPDDLMMEAYATEQRWGTEQKIREAIYLADGHVVELKNILDKPEQKLSETLLQMLKTAYSKNGLMMMQWVEGISNMSHREYAFFIQYQLHFIQESLKGAIRDNYKKRLLPREQKAADWLLNITRFSDLAKLVHNLDHYSRSLDQNANVKILSTKNILDYKRLFDNK